MGINSLLLASPSSRGLNTSKMTEGYAAKIIKQRKEFVNLYYNIFDLSLIPLQVRSKLPAIPTWGEYSQKRASWEQIERWFIEDQYSNIGVVCGKISNNLLVADFDSEEAFTKIFQNKAAEVQNETFTVRTARRSQVWVYDPKCNISKIDFRPTLEMELRFDRHYVK
jgi:hypothetical protein